MHKSLLLTLLLVSLAALHTSAQQMLLDTNKLIVDGRDVTATNYPNADDVMIDDIIQVEYSADGRAVIWDDTAIKVLTETGRRGKRVLSLRFNQSYEKLTLMLVQTIAEDGKVTDLNVEDISSEMIDHSQMSDNIYDPNHKILQARIPDLQLNMIVRYMVKHEIIKPRVPKSFSDYQTFEYTSPILHTAYSVRAPKELPLVNRALLSPVEDTVAYTAEETPEGTLHKWEVNKVPQALPEPQMPTMYTCVQRLLVSTLPTWQDVSKWYWNLCLPHLNTNEEIEAKVKELTDKLKDDTQKIRALFRFVSQEVRYMGETTEKEAPGYEPHDVAQTFGKRHGVCRDKAALLCAMLRSAGFTAYPVLISVGPLKDKEVPQPYFNHAITAIEKDGSYMLMDATNENTKDLFPAYLANCSYLVARPEGEALQTTPVPSSFENRMIIDTETFIDEYGTLKGTTTIHFLGFNDSYYRGFFAGNTPNDTKIFLERLINNTIPGALLMDYTLAPKDMMDTDMEISLKLTFNAPSFISGNENLSFLRMPSFANSFGIHNHIIRDASLDKRRFPFQCRYKCSVFERNTIHYAPKWGVPEQIPEFKEIDSKTMVYNQNIAYHDHILQAESEMRIETIQFSPQEYLELKENLKTIEHNRRKMPVLKRKYTLPDTENEPDIIKLSETTDFVLKNAFSWTEKHYVKYQIMTYGGKKDYSELKFQFFPDCEDFKLDFAKVYNGENCVELNLAENKLMDDDWVGSAPRYPKGKILVANLPAVEIGSIVEYQYTNEHKAGDLPFSYVTTFCKTVPILHESVTISHPEKIPLAFNLSQNGTFMPKGADSIEYRKITNFGVVQHFWNTSNQKAFLHESNLPRLRYIMPSLCVTAGNWKNYCQQLRKAIEARTYDAPAIHKLAEEMKGMDDTKKVRAIRDMVARSIRNAGPRFTELPFNAMSEAAVTLADGYGNAMDRAILIYALLKAAGLKPEFVLAKGGSNAEVVDAELVKFFDPSLFASPLVRVKCDGKWVWLNESNQYAELGTCGYEGQKALTLDGKIFTIEVPDKYKTKVHRKIHIRLFANGDARFEVKKTLYGKNYNSMNKMISEQTQEDRRRYHLSLLNTLSKTATPDGELVTDVKSYPATISYAANLKNFAVEQGNLLYLACPKEGTFNAPQNKRRLPFEYTGHSIEQTDVVIELPDDYPTISYITPSKKFTLPGETYTYAFSASTNKNTINVSSVVNAKPFLIPANKYETLQSVLRQIISPSLNTIILSK